MSIFGAIFLIFLIGAITTQIAARLAIRRVPPVGSFVKTSQGELHYIDIGPRDAPVFVLIHGLYGQLQHFTYALTEPLSQKHRVIAIDRPGCGYSQRIGAPTTAQQGKIIAEALDALDIETPILVGHSLGGAVVLDMACANPEKYSGVVLISPAIAAEPDTHPKIARISFAISRPLFALMSYSLAAPAAVVIRKRFRKRAFAPAPIAPHYSTQGGASLGLRPRFLLAAAEDLSTFVFDARNRIAQLEKLTNTPVGMIYGDQDKVLPPALHRSVIAPVLDVDERLPQGGHMLPLTDPDACVALALTISKLVQDFE